MATKSRPFGRLLSCPSWDRTRTLLIQSQACCQLHQGAEAFVGTRPNSLIIVNIAYSFNPARDSPIRAQVYCDHIANSDRIVACRSPADALGGVRSACFRRSSPSASRSPVDAPRRSRILRRAQQYRRVRSTNSLAPSPLGSTTSKSGPDTISRGSSWANQRWSRPASSTTPSYGNRGRRPTFDSSL